MNGDTAESVGAMITYYQDGYPLPAINDPYRFPYQPGDSSYYGYDYTVWIYAEFDNSGTGAHNYAGDSEYIRVIINVPETPTPVFGDDNLEDGEAQEFGVAYSWKHPIFFREGEGVRFYGTVTRDGVLYEEFELSDDEYLEDTVYRMLKITEAGEYSIDVKARYVSESDYMEGYNVNVSFSVAFTNDSGERLDEIRELGDYTVKVTSASGDVREIDVTVRREIHMQVKPFVYEHSVGYPAFDIKNFVMEAGKVVLLGHEIVDVEYDFYVEGASISVERIIVVDADGNDVSHLYTVYPYDSTDIHVFDSPCDATCNEAWCDYVRMASHSGGVATCSALAVCEHCGSEYGSYQPHRHVSENTVLSPNFNDGMTHNELYTCCGAVKSTVGHTRAVAATCTSLAICAGCGWAYGEFDPNNHASDRMSYSASADDPDTHVATHVCCGAGFAEAHEGGVATCVASAVCEKCNTGYGEINPENHADVTYTNQDGNTHLAKCNDCVTEWVEAHSGGIASCSTLAVCEDCRASYGEPDAENHESDDTKYVLREENPSMHDYVHSCCGGLISKAYHSGGEANCTTAAICEYCAEEYGNKNPDHHASDAVAYRQDPNDPLAHVKMHACCKVEIGIEAHDGEGSADCYHGDICTVCGIEYSEKTGHAYDDENDTRCNVCDKAVASVRFDVAEIDTEANEGESGETDTEGGNDSGCTSIVGVSSGMMTVALSAVWIAVFKKKQD